MAKLNKEQLQQMVDGLKLVIKRVENSDVQVFEMQDCSRCVLGTLFKGEFSISLAGNFKTAFYSVFGYTISMDGSLDSLTLSNLQKELRYLFFPTKFETNSVEKDLWLSVAKKFLKRLEKKLASRS